MFHSILSALSDPSLPPLTMEYILRKLPCYWLNMLSVTWHEKYCLCSVCIYELTDVLALKKLILFLMGKKILFSFSLIFLGIGLSLTLDHIFARKNVRWVTAHLLKQCICELKCKYEIRWLCNFFMLFHIYIYLWFKMDRLDHTGSYKNYWPEFMLEVNI